LQKGAAFATVTAMPPRPHGTTRRVRHRSRSSADRLRRFAVLIVLSSAAVVVLALTAFGGGPATRTVTGAPAPAQRLLPTGPPTPEIVALQGALRLQLPVPQSRVTAIGYHAAGDGALALQPLGRQGNEGLLTRLAHRIFGGGAKGLIYYQLGGGAGAATSALDVGAAPDTDVYSPVDGVVVGLTTYVVNGQSFGKRIDIQPSVAPSVVVSLTQLAPDPALTVGSVVAAGASRLGTVLDLAGVERQALARFTQDRGNHVSVEVHPAATLSVR